MQNRPALKWLYIALAVLALGAILAFAGLQWAARTLKQDLLAVLGPESSVADVRVGFTSVIVSGIDVPGGKGWPARSALSGEKLVATPDLRQLVQRRIVVNDLTVSNAYISAVRAKEGGGLRVLPTLAERKKKEPQTAGRPAEIKTLHLENCILEVFDNTVTGRQKMRVEAVEGTLENVRLPKLEGRLLLELAGAIRGPMHQGTIAVAGWVEAERKSAEITVQVQNVDLALFEPYLIQKTKAGIDRGTFNLEMQASVRNNVVKAPGTLVLSGLKLKSGDGPLGGLSNVPRRALLGAMADDSDRITVNFTLSGDLDDPTFSLSEELTFKTAAGLLKGMGLGFEALIRAIFIILSGFGSALGGAAGA